MAGARIIGRTKVGRATIVVLAMNDELSVRLRRMLIDEGLLP